VSVEFIYNVCIRFLLNAIHCIEDDFRILWPGVDHCLSLSTFISKELCGLEIRLLNQRWHRQMYCVFEQGKELIIAWVCQPLLAKSCKLWFEPLQIYLSAHVLHFFSNYVKDINNICDSFFYGLNVKESKKNYFVHHFHGITPQNTSTKSKKLWFGPLQLCLSAHVLHFFQIMSNTLMIFVTLFFYGLNVKESKRIYFMHQFHGITPQNTSTKSKKLWFGPLQLCLSVHALHFF